MAGRLHRLLTTSVVGVVQRASAMLGTLIIFPVVLHALGTEKFGLWGVAASLSMIINFADFGLGPMIITYVAKELAKGDEEAARHIFGAAFSLAVLIALALTALTPVVLSLPGPTIEIQILAIVTLGVAVNVPLGIANPAWISLQRGWMTALWEFVQTLFFIGGLWIATFYTHDVRIFSACIYVAIVAANGCNIAVLLATERRLRLSPFPASWNAIRASVGPSLRFFMLTMLDALSYLLDPFIALQVLGSLAAAQMAILQRMAVAATGILMILSQYLWPTYVEALVQRDQGWVRRSLIVSILGVGAFALAIYLVLAGLGPWLFRIWLGRDIGFTGSNFAGLAGWILVMGIVRALTTVLNALHDLAFQTLAFALFIVVSLAFKVMLPRWFGIDGILLAVIAVGAVGLIPLLAIRLRGQLKMHFES
jgi:O-antigen/teichoic acid export membrane protein